MEWARWYPAIVMKLPSEAVARLKRFYEGRSVCVTGGAGFIGGHLLDALLSLGASIAVIDDLSCSDVGHVAELIDLEPKRVRFVHGSILDDDALRDAVSGRDEAPAAATVFHLAALGSVPRSIKEPQRTWSVNATGTLRVLEAARNAGAARVVLAASSSAYGDQRATSKVETMVPAPLPPYAASKLAAEQLLAAWSHSYALSTASLRYFNVFGARQSAESQYAAVVPAMIKRLLEGMPPVIYGDGRQTRDMTYVGNAVLGTLLAGACEKPLRGEVVNIGSGARVSILELSQKLAALCGMEGVTPVFEPARTGDVKDSLADITRARELLGYEAFTSLDAGLVETVKWCRQLAEKT